jgi:hypothetical protein
MQLDKNFANVTHIRPAGRPASQHGPYRTLTQWHSLTQAMRDVGPLATHGIGLDASYWTVHAAQRAPCRPSEHSHYPYGDIQTDIHTTPAARRNSTSVPQFTRTPTSQPTPSSAPAITTTVHNRRTWRLLSKSRMFGPLYHPPPH